jgi:hypothetical protein
VKYLNDIKRLLEEGQSKNQTNTIVNYVGDDPLKMSALMSLFMDTQWHWRYNQWAAWPLGYIGRKNPDLVQPYLNKMLELMDNPTHDAVLRNIIRVFEDIEIPEEIEGALYDKCFNFLNDPAQSIAIRCFSMTVLYKIAVKYPDMLHELSEALQMHLPHGSAGFKSRASKIIYKIKKTV